MCLKQSESQAFAADSVDRRRTTVSFESVTSLLPVIDLLIILAASLAGALSYEFLDGDAPGNLLGVGTVAGCVYVFRMQSSGYYDIRLCLQSRLEAGQIVRAWTTSVFVLVLLAFLFKIGAAYSRGSIAAFLLLGLTALVAWRAATKRLLRRAVKKGVVGRHKVVMIGEHNELASLGVEQLLSFFGVVDATRFTLGDGGGGRAMSASDASTLESAIDFVRDNDSDEILLALPWRNSDALQPIRDRLRVLPVPVRLLPDHSLRSITSYPSFASALQLTFLVELQAAPLNYAEQIIKRLLDVVLASIALVMLLPVMILAAIAIKLESSGPVIFRQRRNGFNGKQFLIYKFRTMIVQEDGPVVTQVSQRDSRVTQIGRLLRMMSIDELPQVLNVLRGEMSLVGPRPHAVSHNHQFQNAVADYAFRHHMKPGITGWAQCHGARGSMSSLKDIETRVALDLWYINNWSPWLDLRILFMTPFELLRWGRAY